jgi:hypothetical protein
MDAADAASAADALDASWRAIDVALSPIIGPRGTLAIQSRSLHVAALAHPWLAAIAREPQEAANAAALRLLVGRQDRDDAVAGAQALLHAVIELLDSLIGPSLTERLLRSVWTNATQDRS